MRQPGSEGLLEFARVPRQMVVKLSQMHAGAKGMEAVSNLLEPAQTGLATAPISRQPAGGDPRFPLGLAVDERAAVAGLLAHGATQLLASDRSSVVRAIGHGNPQCRDQGLALVAPSWSKQA